MATGRLGRPWDTGSQLTACIMWSFQGCTDPYTYLGRYLHKWVFLFSRRVCRASGAEQGTVLHMRWNVGTREIAVLHAALVGVSGKHHDWTRRRKLARPLFGLSCDIASLCCELRLFVVYRGRLVRNGSDIDCQPEEFLVSCCVPWSWRANAVPHRHLERGKACSARYQVRVSCRNQAQVCSYGCTDPYINSLNVVLVQQAPTMYVVYV
jgi:hypothetical protein